MLEAVVGRLPALQRERVALVVVETHLILGLVLLEVQTLEAVEVAAQQEAQQAALVLSSSNGHNLYQPQQHLLQQANGKPLRA
jgi:flagellar biogenesis protein FliO